MEFHADLPAIALTQQLRAKSGANLGVAAGNHRGVDASPRPPSATFGRLPHRKFVCPLRILDLRCPVLSHGQPIRLFVTGFAENPVEKRTPGARCARMKRASRPAWGTT